jgi:HEAT repeat protein
VRALRFCIAASTLVASVLSAAGLHAQPAIPEEEIPSHLEADVREAFHQLYSDDPRARAGAASRLAGMGPQAAGAAVPFLVSMLGDDAQWEEGDPRCEIALVVVNERVAWALGRIGEPAVQPLIAALDDERPVVRRRAAQALGVAECTEAVVPLVEALKDDDWRVRAFAAGALQRLPDARSVDALVVALTDEESNVREAASEALARIGRPAGDALLAVVGDGSQEFPPGALLVLGRIGEPRALGPVLAAFESEDRIVRGAAARAAGMLGDPRAVQGLIKLLDDPDGQVRSSAVVSLQNTCCPDPVPQVIRALEDRDALVRVAAIRTLRRIGDPRAVEPLIARLDDPSKENRHSALMALRQITGQELDQNAEAWRTWWRKNYEQFTQAGPPMLSAHRASGVVERQRLLCVLTGVAGALVGAGIATVVVLRCTRARRSEVQ